MIPEQAKLEIRRRKEAGETWTGIAQWITEEYGIDIHRTTIQRWYDKEVYLDFQEEDNWISEKDTPAERIKLDKKVVTHKAEATFYKKLYEQAIKDSSKKEIIVDAIKNNAQAFSPVKLSYKSSSKQKKTSASQVVVAPLTDLHIGDRVEEEQMAGLNEYSIDIFNKRLFGWAEKLVELVELRRQFASVDRLVIPMLGDMISGDIHEELARTNLDNCMGQMIRGANLVAQALMFLASDFKEIHVPCVVGNHGRMTRKPPMKDKYMDWDYMLYQWVAAFCREQKNITFDIQKAFINSFEAANKEILIMHGDSVPGAGLGTAILRQVSNFRNVLNYRFDSVMMGHFHRVDEFDIGTGEVHICGTMKGGDEYALQKLVVYTPPKHIVTYWHPKYGYIGKEVIYLNRYDNSKNSFQDDLSEVWIN